MRFRRNIQIASNTSKIQAVQQKELGITQIIFYEPGTFEWAKGKSITFNDRGLVMIETYGEEITKITVADPSRKHVSFNFSLNSRFTGADSTWKAVWNEEKKISDVTANLPSGFYKGKGLVMRNVDEEPDYSLLNNSGQSEFEKSNDIEDKGKHYIGEKFGGGIVIWLDENERPWIDRISIRQC